MVIQHYKNYPKTIPVFNREHNLHKFGYAVARTDTVVFDKACNMYRQYSKCNMQQVWFVTWMKDNAIYQVRKVLKDNCVLIAQLLMVVIRRKVETKKSFTNMITVVRLHLMSYVNLFEFIKDTYSA